ncbi:hypothetical protein CBL_14425 [Carabus blaptoides fortunei]
MKMLNCAGVLLAVLYLVVVWANAGVIQDCFPNSWDLADVKAHPETACAVDVIPDEDYDRIPPVLYMVKCKGCNSKCPMNYKCTQLKANIEVRYNSTGETQEYTLHTGCMCAKQGEGKPATTDSGVTYR